MRYNQLENQEGMGGITSRRYVKRDWHYCPRCRQKTVDKSMRRCTNCSGRLLWDGDDGQALDREGLHWFLFHHSIMGISGWFDKSYFKS